MNFPKGWQGFAILGLLVGMIFYFYSRKKPGIAEQETRRTESAVVSSAPKQEMITSSEAQTSKAAAAASRHQYNAMVTAGVREIPSRRVGSDLKFSFRMVTVPIWCNLGDFDFLKGLVNNISKPLFLLTIEPLSGDRSKMIRRRLSLHDIKAAKAQDGLLLAQDQPRDYGVYLCFDPENTNECSNKEVMASNSWNQALNAKPKANSKILYFQLLTVKEKRAFLIPGHKWDSATIKSLEKSLKPIIESDSSLEKMKSHLDVLQSVPGRITKNVLEFPLPYKDPSC